MPGKTFEAMADVSAAQARSVDRVAGAAAQHVWPVLVAVVPLTFLGFAQGGYFPWSWGWATLVLLWGAGVALVLRSAVRLTRPEAIFVVLWLTLLGWIALSSVWSSDQPQTVLEIERTLIYVSGIAALVALARTGSTRHVLGGILAAISLIASFSLATRLFPDQLRVYDPTAVYRLAQPVGYWNGLAILTGMGALLALGFVARGRRLVVRALSAALLPLLLATFYFTFGRAGWVALAAGIVFAIVLDPRRLQLLVTLLAVAPAAVASVWLAADSRGLTRSGSSAAHAARDGQRLALALCLLAVLAAVTVIVVAFVERRIAVPRRARRVFVGAVVVMLAGGLALAFGRYGGPDTLVRKGYAAFKAPPPHVDNLNRRLLSFSGNGRYDLWRLAWADALKHPWVGSGSGSYERYFLQHQPASVGRVRDAHGLYIETLAELGPLGLILLLAGLTVPLLVAVRARSHPLVPPAAGAYAAFLVHAIADWDWEMPVVTLAALMCGGAILLAGRSNGSVAHLSMPIRGLAVATVIAAAAFAIVGLLGNSALRSSVAARGDGNLEQAAADARRARVWMPWSPRPWSALGEAQLAAGLVGRARASFQKALSLDTGNWRLWYDVARATSGPARAAAIRHAVVLYPRSGLSPKPGGKTGAR